MRFGDGSFGFIESSVIVGYSRCGEIPSGENTAGRSEAKGRWEALTLDRARHRTTLWNQQEHKALDGWVATGLRHKARDQRNLPFRPHSGKSGLPASDHLLKRGRARAYAPVHAREHHGTLDRTLGPPVFISFSLVPSIPSAGAISQRIFTYDCPTVGRKVSDIHSNRNGECKQEKMDLDPLTVKGSTRRAFIFSSAIAETFSSFYELSCWLFHISTILGIVLL